MRRKLYLSTMAVVLTAASCLFFVTGGALLAAEDDGADVMALGEETDIENVVFRVRITNLTKGQPFSRIVLATHRGDLRYFELGAQAPRPVVALAEHGNPAPLARFFAGQDGVRDVSVTEGPLAPGDSVVMHLRGGGPYTRLSVGGMLVGTNDGFFALNSARGPVRRDRRVRFSPAYDAGSELNDELCSSIPGPFCGGNGGLEGEGFVHVHNGIHGIGDLEPARRDFRNPVARIQVERIVVPAE